MLGTFISSLHVVTAAVLDIIPAPETLPDTDVTLLDMFMSSAGSGACWTCGREGCGDLSTGTTGTSVDLCPFSLP